MQLKALSRLIAQFRDAGSNQNRIRRIRRRAATQGRDVRLQVADAISGGLLEELESRALLAGDPITANLTSGSLVISDLVGGNDSLQLTRSGSDLVITVGAGSTIGTNAGTGDGTNSVAIPIASITAGVTVDAGNGNDSVTLDFTGNINFPVGVTILGGAGTDTVNLDSDITFASASSLVVTAESVTTGAGVDLTTSGTGAITFTADDVAIDSTGTLVTPNTLTLTPQTASRTINLGTETAGSLSLTDTELDTISAGTIQIGNTNSGAITVSAAITSNRNLSLTTGSGGVVSTGGSLGTTGSTITLNTNGPIGTAANRIQFADNTNTAQQNVVIGSTNQASSVYLDGLGSLTLGSISGSTANATIDVTARAALVVAASSTINSGTSPVRLGADLTAAGAGDNGTGTLTVSAGANVYGAAITLRGADEDIASTATVGSVSSLPVVGAFVGGGLNGPFGVVLDSSGNLYVSNRNNNTITQVTPAGSVSTFVSSGLSGPQGMAFDSSGNLYVANGVANTISKVTPGGSVSTFATGLNGPCGLAFDSSGNLYVANGGANTISKVTSGGSVSTFATGLNGPTGLAFDSSGNLYVANFNGNSISKVTSGGSVSTFATGMSGPENLAFDSSGNLYVANYSNSTISKVTSGGSASAFVSSGLNGATGVVFDTSGNLYVANYNANTISKVVQGAPVTTSVTVQSSVANRPLSIGGTNTAVGGINLTDAELARLFTSSTGTITFGDTAQTGDITFTTATTATTAGASTTVIQSTAGAGKIVLDDAANTGVALSGNGGTISLTAGTGGITAAHANNAFAEISTTGATVTMNTTGPIGTSANRIQFADNTTTTQQNVVIGSINQASSVYLDGLGSLTLGSISGGTANTTIDVTARTNLVVAAGATIISGTSSNSLGADLKADGTGDEGTGTLTIGAGSNVYGATINLRGADEAIDSTAKVGSAGIPAVTTYTSSISSQPRGIAFDSSGNLYAITWGTGILYRVAPGGGSVTTIASGFVSAQGVAVDSSGNVYVCDVNGNVFKNPVGAGAKTPFVTVQGILYNMVVKGGDLYVTNYSGVKKITNLAGTPIVSDYATGAASASGLAFDSSGNLFISCENGNLYKVAANASIPAAATLINSGLNSEALAIDASDNLYLSTFGSTIRKLAPSGTGTATSIATGLNLTFGLAVDASGNVYVSDNGGNSIVKVTATIVATNQLTVRSSQPSRPIALGGGTAVAGINLSDAELGRMVTSSGGTVTIGDTAQTGDITFSTATVATSGGTSTTVIQSTAGAGKIVLDDGANTGTALSGNGGVISLTAGTGGITATAANNTSAEISTTGATVTMNTTGPIGTSANRIQFANNTNTAQQNVVIGSTNQASSVFLGGVGSLTLGAINDSTRNAAIDVTAGNQLVVTAAVTTLGGNISFAAANGVTLTGSAAAVSTVGGSTATLSQAGSDLTTNDAWRTSGVVKTRDADGDNIYGTAGYYLYGSASSQPTLVPSFATVAVAAGTVQYGPDVTSYVRLDDPALTGVAPVANVSTGTRYRASQAANQEGDLVVITITQAGSFRLGVIQDNHDLTAISPLSLRVRQTTGGSADSGYLSATAERNLDGDYFFFDFINAQVGSVYTLSGVNDGGFPSNGIYGVTFDKIQGGTYTVNADTDNDGGGAYIQNNAGSTAATGGGNVSITAADATLLGTTNAGGGRVTIVPTNSRQIDLERLTKPS